MHLKFLKKIKKKYVKNIILDNILQMEQSQFGSAPNLLNENEKICYQWENNCFQMIHSMIEYTLIANKGDEVHVRLFRPRLFRKVVPFFEELYGNTGYRYSNIQ